MAYSTPMTWVAGYAPLPSDMNREIRDNIAYLHDRIALLPNTNVPILIAANNTENSVSNSTVETTMWSMTLPGNTLGANDALLFNFFVSILNNSGGAQTYTFRLKYGGTTIITNTVSGLAASASAQGYALSIGMKNAGATNSQKAIASVFVPTGGGTLIGTAAIDSTANQTLSLTAQCSTNTATQTITHWETVVQYMKNT